MNFVINNCIKTIVAIVYLLLISEKTIAQTNSFPPSGNVGIGTLSPQSSLDVITPVNGYSSFGNIFSPGSFSGIHFGYRETNSYYRKSALIFQRTDGHNHGGNASGKIHFLLRNDGIYSATDLNDAVVTIDSDPNGNRGTVRFGIGTQFPQSPLDVITPVNGFSSFGNTISPGSFSGIHFGYREPNSYYRKSALIFERTDSHNQGGNASGKIHFLLRNDGQYSATDLNDAVVTIDSDPNGNRGSVRFGVGNSTPQTLLHLSGSHTTTQFRLTLPSIANGAGNGEISLQSWVSEPGVSWDAGGIGMNVSNNNGSPSQFGRLNTQIGQSYIRFIPNGGAMEFNTTDNAGTSHKTSMYLSNGKLGIGTQNPTAKLDVIGGINISPDFGIRKSGDNWIIGYSNSLPGVVIGSGTETDQLTISSGGAERMRFSNNGNVGIGTSTPDNKLTVNGNIKAKKLIITQAGWADYVFKPNYKLMSLDSLNHFIIDKRHLPDMPDETKILKEGNDVGNTQVLLLKKIEELTLYIIQLNNKIEKQNKEIKLLQLKKNR